MSDDGESPGGLRWAPAGRITGSSVADGVEHRLDPRSVTVDRITGGISATIFSAALLMALLLFSFFGPLEWVGGLFLIAGWIALVLLLAVFSLWWPAVRYRHTAYTVSDLGIRIRRGVLWRSVSSVPRSRVQHTDISQGPIERAYELATLVIYTAGTHHASTLLGGLPRDRALLIRDHLIAGGEDDAV